MLYNYDDKDILTFKDIKRELKKHFVRKLVPLLILFPILELLCYLIMGIYVTLPNVYPEIDFEVSFSKDFYTVTHSVILVLALPSVIGFIKVLFGKFKVESDFLADKYIDRVYGPSSLASPGVYTLVFAFNGKHRIPFGRNHKWSKYFEIDEQDIYNTSLLSDEFYLVSVGKKKNLLAFNKKLFTLETEIPQD